MTEYRRHRLRYPRCGRVTCPARPADARGGYGPRVQAACALLSGAYRVGKRGVARLMGDLFGVPISPAAVCDLQHKTAAALEPVVRDAHPHPVVGRQQRRHLGLERRHVGRSHGCLLAVERVG